MSSVRSIRPMPSHIAHDNARSVSSSASNCSPPAPRSPRRHAIRCDRSRNARRTRPRSAPAGCNRPGPPLGGVIVEILVHARRGPLGVTGVLAHHAFVVQRDHHAGPAHAPAAAAGPCCSTAVGVVGHARCRSRETARSSRPRRRREILRYGSWPNRPREPDDSEQVLDFRSTARAGAARQTVVAPLPLHHHPMRRSVRERPRPAHGRAGPRTAATSPATCRRFAPYQGGGHAARPAAPGFVSSHNVVPGAQHIAALRTNRLNVGSSTSYGTTSRSAISVSRAEPYHLAVPVDLQQRPQAGRHPARTPASRRRSAAVFRVSCASTG